ADLDDAVAAHDDTRVLDRRRAGAVDNARVVDHERADLPAGERMGRQNDRDTGAQERQMHSMAHGGDCSVRRGFLVAGLVAAVLACAVRALSGASDTTVRVWEDWIELPT